MAWDPTSLSNLVAWLEAGPTWCFSDVGGTTPCIVGDEIKCWKTRNVGGANFTISSTKGFFLAQDVNSRYYASSPNVPSAVNISGMISTGVMGTGDQCIAVTGFESGPAVTGGSARMLNSSTVNALISFSRVGIGSFTGGLVSTYVPGNSNPHVGLNGKASGGNWRYRQDGVDRTTATASSNWGTPAMGRTSGTGEGITGGIYGLVFCQSNPLTTLQSDLETYMASLFGPIAQPQKDKFKGKFGGKLTGKVV